MFKDWLLKDEKSKVGRPKLANDEVLKKAKISIVLSIIVCFVMSFMFVCEVKNVSPGKYAYSLTFAKLGATINNKDGFIVKEKYNKNSDYVIDIKPSKKVKSYQGRYKYILYKLNGSKWKKIDEKEFNNKGTKVIVESLKNKNETYKISLYIINGSKVSKSFEPFSWEFVDSSKQEEKYAYKVFTVKGYYSPISLDETKESKTKEKTKVTISTTKNNARTFTINVPKEEYKLNVSYTDDVDKKIVLVNEKKLTGKYEFKIPNVNKVSNVTVKVYLNEEENFKLSNWKVKEDSKKQKYITNTYMLKPEKTY